MSKCSRDHVPSLENSTSAPTLPISFTSLPPPPLPLPPPTAPPPPSCSPPAWKATASPPSPSSHQASYPLIKVTLSNPCLKQKCLLVSEWQCLASWMGPGVQYSLLSSTTSSSLSCLALWEEQGGYRTTVSLGGCWQGQDRGQEQGQEQEQDHESSTTLGAVLFKAGDCSPQALATANSAPGLPTETAWPGLPTGTPCWFLPILVLHLLANMATACSTGP